MRTFVAGDAFDVVPPGLDVYPVVDVVDDVVGRRRDPPAPVGRPCRAARERRVVVVEAERRARPARSARSRSPRGCSPSERAAAVRRRRPRLPIGVGVVDLIAATVLERGVEAAEQARRFRQELLALVEQRGGVGCVVDAAVGGVVVGTVVGHLLPGVPAAVGDAYGAVVFARPGTLHGDVTTAGPAEAADFADVRARLDAHLASWLGEWPPSDDVVVTTSPARTAPGWDGTVLAFVGVRSPLGTVVSVAPDHLDEARSAISEGRVAEAFFRWCEAAPSTDRLAPLGAWVPATDERVPAWLQPFGHDVLVAFDESTGRYAAGVGLKRHDDHAWEISVGTDPAHEGRGLARRLVASAARRVIDEGRVPTYLHDPSNAASARVAGAAGFPDRGWRLFVLRSS